MMIRECNKLIQSIEIDAHGMSKGLICKKLNGLAQ